MALWFYGFVAATRRFIYTYFGDPLRCPHKRIVTITKVYIARNNMQVQVTRFHKKYRLYSRLLLRSEGALGPLYVYSLFARWQQLVTRKERNLHCDVHVAAKNRHTLLPFGSRDSFCITRSQRSRRRDKGLWEPCFSAVTG